MRGPDGPLGSYADFTFYLKNRCRLPQSFYNDGSCEVCVLCCYKNTGGQHLVKSTRGGALQRHQIYPGIGETSVITKRPKSKGVKRRITPFHRLNKITVIKILQKLLIQTVLSTQFNYLNSLSKLYNAHNRNVVNIKMLKLLLSRL